MTIRNTISANDSSLLDNLGLSRSNSFVFLSDHSSISFSKNVIGSSIIEADTRTVNDSFTYDWRNVNWSDIQSYLSSPDCLICTQILLTFDQNLIRYIFTVTTL